MRVAAGFAILAIATGLAACGGGGGHSPTDPVPPEPPPEPATRTIFFHTWGASADTTDPFEEPRGTVSGTFEYHGETVTLEAQRIKDGMVRFEDVPENRLVTFELESGSHTIEPDVQTFQGREAEMQQGVFDMHNVGWRIVRLLIATKEYDPQGGLVILERSEFPDRAFEPIARGFEESEACWSLDSTWLRYGTEGQGSAFYYLRKLRFAPTNPRVGKGNVGFIWLSWIPSFFRQIVQMDARTLRGLMANIRSYTKGIQSGGGCQNDEHSAGAALREWYFSHDTT